MSLRDTLVRTRELLPQTIRFRLAILYAGLFLIAGIALLGLTYGLLANRLPNTTSISKNQTSKMILACRQGEQAARSKGQKSGKAPAPLGPCLKASTESANAATESQRAQTLHELLIFSLLGLGVMTLVSGGLGWFMAGRVLRPMSAITGAARRASERHLGERLDLQGPRDELKELADTFDQMLERLDTAFASQRRFVANASHELRTPLTVMRTAIDVTLAKPDRSKEQVEAMAAKVRRSVDQAEKLIDALLTLAVSEREIPRGEFVDLATAAEDAVDAAALDIEQMHLQVNSSFDPAETWGDQSLLERLVGNLVDNAIRHNIPDGRIDIRTGRSAEDVYIEVSNSGQQIDEGLLESLFEPFKRVEERTNTAAGVGLGLAIVKSITTAHGGTLSARSLAEGGLEIAVHLSRDRSNGAGE